jgi:uncharacterized protein (TIGR00645 family)
MSGDPPAVKRIELLIEAVLLGSRWILVVLYLGLAVALGLYSISFLFKLTKVATHLLVWDENQMILAMLGLVDAALVGSLLVMVMISGYENFIGRFDKGDDADLSWLGKLDAGSLKVKVASSIVAISSIHLLQVFLNTDQFGNDKIMWAVIIHLTFVASALMLGFLDRMTSKKAE